MHIEKTFTQHIRDSHVGAWENRTKLSSDSFSLPEDSIVMSHEGVLLNALTGAQDADREMKLSRLQTAFASGELLTQPKAAAQALVSRGFDRVPA